MERFRGGLVFKAHRLCVSLNSRLESNKEEKKKKHLRPPDCLALAGVGRRVGGRVRVRVRVRARVRVRVRVRVRAR